MKWRSILSVVLCCVLADGYPSVQEGGRSVLLADCTQLPRGFLPFEEFERQFKLEATSTEQRHPLTMLLSQTIHRSISEGLERLLDVDESVVDGLEAFIPFIERLSPLLAGRVERGGRVFLIGSGSSGRMAIDIAAKCNRVFPEARHQVLGVIAGGDSAMVRAKEGFEDSEMDGANTLEKYNVCLDDAVILISASGSASFNVGCGHFAADRGADVFYFYNSRSVPSRTQQLFDRTNNPVVPLCIDIGPQAITGSTRLQGATLAEAGVGALLASALYLNRGCADLAQKYPQELVLKMREGLRLIREKVDRIALFVAQERDVFADVRSNFRQLRDITDRGYVTIIAAEESIREVLIDATETSPTFSSNPIRREGEGHKKRAEFRAYLVNEEDNREAWKALLGRAIREEDLEDTDAFLLSDRVEGENSYRNRPVGEGNFLLGVAKIDPSQPPSEKLFERLEEAKQLGGEIGLLLICKEGEILQLHRYQEACCTIENVPDDTLGIVETVVLKQVLNLISNGSMLLMNKIHGNLMIDVRASNQKLIGRCVRLIKEIGGEYGTKLAFDDKELYYYVARVSAVKDAYEAKGVYTPSVVKIVLAMLALGKTADDFQEIVDLLGERQEKIDWIGA